MNLLELNAVIKWQDDGYEQGVENAGKKADELAKKEENLEKSNFSLKGTFTSLKDTVIAVKDSAIVQFGLECANAAEALELTSRKTDIIFGEMAQDVNDWALENERTFGLGSGTIAGYMNSVADLAQGMGMAKDTSVDFSKGVMELGAQLANWNNIDPAQAINDLNSAMTGNTKGLEKYGIKINDAAKEQAMMNLGLEGTYDSLDNATKAQVIYQAALDASGNAVENWEAGNRSSTFYLTEMKEQIGNMKETIGSFLLPALKQGTKFLADFAYGVNTVVTEIGTFGNTLIDNVKAMDEFSFHGVVDALDKTMQDIYGINLDGNIKEIFNKIADGFEGFWNTFQDIWNTVAAPLFEILKKAFNILLQVGTMAFNGIATVFKIMADYWATVWENVLKPIVELFMSLLDGLLAIVEKNMPMISEIWNNMCELIEDAWEALKPVFEIIGAAVEKLAAVFEFCFETIIYPVVENVFNRIKVIWNNLLYPVLKGIIDFIKNVFTGNWKGAWENIKDIIANIFKGIFTVIVEILSDIIANAMGFVADLGKAAIDAGAAFFNNLWNAVKSLPSKFLQLGKDIVSGVWNGITAMTDWLVDKVTGFFSGIANTAKKVLGIASPSKVFKYQVGVNIVKGAEEGILEEAPELTETIEEAFEDLPDVDLNMPKIDLDKYNNVIDLEMKRKEKKDKEEKENDNDDKDNKNIVVVLDVDGHEFARAVAPEINTELNKEIKRKVIVKK